jgi:hypothetical protein
MATELHHQVVSAALGLPALEYRIPVDAHGSEALGSNRAFTLNDLRIDHQGGGFIVLHRQHAEDAREVTAASTLNAEQLD